jgi:hypothetical protein
VKSLSLVALPVRLALRSPVRGKRIRIKATTCTKFQLLRGGMKIMASLENRIGAMRKIIVAATLASAALACLAAPAGAQGSRKDDIVFGPSGHPIAGATPGKRVRRRSAPARGCDCVWRKRGRRHGRHRRHSGSDHVGVQRFLNQHGGGSIYFPPGVYLLTQPQLPSTAAVFSLPSSGLHLLGGNGSGFATGGAQFNRAPQTRLVVSNVGSSPNGAAVFSTTYPVTGETTWENLTINAHNEAISMYTSNENLLRNVCLTTAATGQTDNTTDSRRLLWESIRRIRNSIWM